MNKSFVFSFAQSSLYSVLTPNFRRLRTEYFTVPISTRQHIKYYYFYTVIVNIYIYIYVKLMFSMDIWCFKRIIDIIQRIQRDFFSHKNMLERWSACPSLIVPNRELWNYKSIMYIYHCDLWLYFLYYLS